HEDVGAHVSGIIVTKLPPNGDDLYVYGSRASYGTPPTADEQLGGPDHASVSDRVSELSGSARPEHEVRDEPDQKLHASRAERHEQCGPPDEFGAVIGARLSGGGEERLEGGVLTCPINSRFSRCAPATSAGRRWQRRCSGSDSSTTRRSWSARRAPSPR